MKAFLMYRDRDIDPAHELSASEQALVQDLELDTLWAAMAAGDDFLLDMARQTVLHSLPSAEAITTGSTSWPMPSGSPAWCGSSTTSLSWPSRPKEELSSAC